MPENLPRKVVITGYGAYTSVGETAAATYEAMLRGERGIRNERQWLEEQAGPAYVKLLRTHLAARVKDPELLNDPAIAARIDQRFIDRFLSRSAQNWWIATAEAARHSGLTTDNLELSAVEPELFASAVGTGIGGAIEVGNFKEKMLGGVALDSTDMNKAQPENAEVTSAWLYKALGAGITVTKACASSNYAIADAVRRIRAGENKAMFAGGTEGLDTSLIVAFERTKAGSFDDDPHGASRPFHRTPGKAVLSEGAAVLVLEDEEHALARKATIYGEIAGYGETNDANDPTLLDVIGIVRAMRLALSRANVTPEDKILPAAHATATPAGDVAEAKALHEVFNGQHYLLDQIKKRVSSTKGYTGHPVGPATAVAAVAYLQAMNEGMLMPAVWLDGENDEEETVIEGMEDLVPDTKNPQSTDGANVILLNGMGFYGQNSSVVIKEYPQTT